MNSEENTLIATPDALETNEHSSARSGSWLYQDQDGYPSQLALSLIEEANPLEKNPKDLMGFIKNLWQYNDWGWKEKESSEFRHKEGILYSLSTGGWSGNESLINALRSNKNHFWSFYWKESHKGGHYKFFIPHRKEDTDGIPKPTGKTYGSVSEMIEKESLGSEVKTKFEELQTKTQDNPENTMNNDSEYSTELERIFNEIMTMDLERKKYKEMFEEQIKETAKLKVENHRLQKKLYSKSL